jgi:N-hydroxyarylamine O-acetyltransferase
MQAIDLDAYFKRILWAGDTSPTLETLSGLLDAHMTCIPFENLDVLLGRPINLDLESVQNKLVRDGRGGYCMEHGMLFGGVLEQLGFKLHRHSARVVMQRPLIEAPRTHMFLTVQFGAQTFVVDPGFGSLAPRKPILLVETDGGVKEAAHWMIRCGNRWIMRAQSGDDIVDAWSSTLEVENPVDFKMASHFTSSFPESPFVLNVMLRALTPDGYIAVMNRNVKVWRGDQYESSILANRQALRCLLNEHFGFDLAEVEQIRVPGIPEWE